MDSNQPRSLTPREAEKILKENPRAILVDIRSTMEFLFVGHPVGAVHIPWIDEPEWDINPEFVTEIRKLLLGGAACDEKNPCAPVILICRSGKRSLQAGKALLEAGMQDIYHVKDGFEGDLNEHHQRSTINGWRFRGLPWEQC